jgi:hypothetical protein
MDLETFQGAGPGNIVPRSNASQGVVVHLLKDNIIRYEMCIHSPIDMQINNIVYSNDAGNVGDVISFDIDGNLMNNICRNREVNVYIIILLKDKINKQFEYLPICPTFKCMTR